MKKRNDLNDNHGLSSEAVKYAAKEGLDVRFPKDNELFIDIDSEAGYDQFNRAYILLLQTFSDGLYFTETPSKSDGIWKDGEFCFRRHIVVQLPMAVTLIERVAYQAILGSDYKHELLTIKNIRDGDPSPTLFFEAKK